MKASDLRPCDNCGGKIAPLFYVIRFSVAVIDGHAVNELMGLTQMFDGHMQLAEVFSSHGSLAHVAMDEKDSKELMTELYLCGGCYADRVNLALLAERRAKAQKQQEAPDKT